MGNELSSSLTDILCLIIGLTLKGNHRVFLSVILGHLSLEVVFHLI